MSFRSVIALAAAAAALSPAFADVLDEVTIVGEQLSGEQVAGSAHYLSADQIERLGHADIQRIIRQIPGVSIQVEDGYGLRPNISIRGVATERSGRITLLEDNVLIAPAPYSAPSAYYFPTMGRMAGVEVLKGPASITQGPYTIGGALNMISTPIPETASGRLVAEAGEDATYRLHASYGMRSENGLGFLLETHQWQSHGFQKTDRGGDTGLDLEDYMIKLAYAPDGSNHAFELKYQKADQDSNQSYLGLTDTDFASHPIRRYGLSDLDNIHTEHDQVILRWDWDISENLELSATYYNNEHLRNWFKTEGIDFDGSANAQEFSRTSWFSVIQSVNQGNGVGGLGVAELQGILDGSLDTAVGAVQVRSNAREYYSRGIQLGLDLHLETNSISHDISLGLRRHDDEEDRLQRNSAYTQQNGTLVLADIGLLGNAGNRVQEAEALSFHIYDRIESGSWVFTPGIRYEDIDQARTRWETRNGRTTDPASREAANFRDSRQNSTRIWLPGMGVVYSLDDASSMFGGVHKGFTAPSNAPDVKPETAINYELGYRFAGTRFNAEIAYFLSDYDNLLGECTASSGSDCMIGDAFNGDAATVQGIEAVLNGDLVPKGAFSVPVNFTYSYIRGEFDTDIADTDFFGNVSAGDPIPYIPEHQFNLVVGIEQSRWGLYLAANLIDEVCVRAACGDFERTDKSLTVDLSGNYDLTDTVQLFGRVENLGDSNDIMGRHPYGARPNKARTASLGVRVDL